MKMYLYNSKSRRECFALSICDAEDNLPTNLGPWEKHNNSMMSTSKLDNQTANILMSKGYLMFFAERFD